MKPYLLHFLIIILLLSGCAKDNGIKIGFEYEGMLPSSTLCAIKSEKTDFPVDQVVIEVSYSLYKEVGEVNDYRFAGFALYFCNSEFNDIPVFLEPLEDYRSIEGLYPVKEIGEGEYEPEDYTMVMDMFSGKKFKHKEIVRVPQEVFTGKEGSFSFRILSFSYMSDNGYYCMTYGSSVNVAYEYLDEQTIRLSD